MMKMGNNFYTTFMTQSRRSQVRFIVCGSCFKVENCTNYKKSVTNVCRRYQTIASSVREIPEDPVNSVLGKIRFLITSGWGTRLHEYVDQRHKELGPIYRSNVGPVSAIFINSPEEYKKIFLKLEGSMPRHFIPEAWILYNNQNSKNSRGLFFMDGEEWLYFRTKLNKLLLHTSSTDFMIYPCEKVAKDLIRDLHPYAVNDVVVPNLKLQMYNYSIQAILATLIGSSWHTHKSEVLKASNNLSLYLYKIFQYSSRLNVISAKIAKDMNLLWWRQFVQVLDDVLNSVRAMLSLMMKFNGDGLLQRMMDSEIKDNDLVRIVADLIIAAGDTTTASIQWALYLISTHPEIQENLYENIKNKESKDILSDPLLKGVLKETLRLYPTAPFLTRYINEDSLIGGYSVSKQDLLLMSLYSSGRDSANFVEPDKFLPERWNRSEKGGYEGVLHPGATIPFAIGVRSCIGKKLAEIKISLAVAEIVKNFRIECINKRPVKMILQLIAETSEPIQLKLIPR